MLFVSGFVAVSTVFAKVGVGIGTGKIVVDEPLKAGMVNKLPSITVVNTGDVPSEYVLSVQYHQDQEELLPSRDWFVFSPEKFPLEPGAVQLVEISLRLPVAVEPGNYFAYLEAGPTSTDESGASRVGIAAAAKLNFSIEPANIFMGVYYRITTLWSFYQPWSSRVALACALLIGAALVRRYVKIELRGTPKNTEPEGEKKPDSAK